MNYVTVSELRRKPSEIWRRVETGEAIGITRHGKSIAMLVGIEPRGLEAAVHAHRLKQFSAAFQHLRESARSNGADQLSDEEIQAEVDAVRRERAARWRNIG